MDWTDVSQDDALFQARIDKGQCGNCGEPLRNVAEDSDQHVCPPLQEIHCARCGETRKTWSLWKGFALAPGIDMVCCLVDDAVLEVNDHVEADR